MNAIVHIKLNLIISTTVGLLVALFFIFLPNIASILPAKISNTLNNIYNLKSWSQLIPLYIVIFFVGLAKNISSLYSNNNKMILLILLLLDIVQIMLFLFLFLDTPFFNKNYLYISKSSQFIFIFAFSIVLGFEIIGDLIRLL